jgi:hypothetical protein
MRCFMSQSAAKKWATPALGLAVWVAASTASAAALGVECKLDRRSPGRCPAAGCAAADIKPYDDSRWYLIDPAQRRIEEYALNGADRGGAFRQLTIADNGEIRAEGGDIDLGEGTVSAIAVNPITGKGAMSILVLPGGEFGGGAGAYSLSGACSLRSPSYITSDKRPKPSAAPR